VSSLEAGSTLGGYKILARLRAGAMGVLYLARRLGPAGFARPVAIKVIHEHLAQNKRFARMFIAEAKLSARIDDPHVVRVEEFGDADGRYYLVMEFVHGVSLAQALGVLRKRGGLPVDVSVAIAMDVASGLHAAHEATDEDGQPLGIVHRDVSPHNVLVSYKGYVKVIDFGIAKAKESAGQTLTGSIRGKLAYMPPEQARSAKHVDRRADLYALGLVLWEMLAGRRMFDGTNDIALLNQIKNPVIVRPSGVNDRVPKELDDVVMKLLEQDPEKRPPTGATVARMLATAWPPATRVLAADIASVMNDVRDAAMSAKPTDEDDGSSLYGEEVKKGLTIFGRSMHESVEAADGVLADLASSRDVDASAKKHDAKKQAAQIVQEETEVMAKAPVARPPPKDTIKMGPPSVMVDESDDGLDDETTKRVTPPQAQRIPRHTGNQGRTIPLGNPPLAAPANDPAPAPGAPAPPSPPPMMAMLPAWVTPPVMVLAPLTVALAIALVIVQCGSRGDDARSQRTPPMAVSSSTVSPASPATDDILVPPPSPPVATPPAIVAAEPAPAPTIVSTSTSTTTPTPTTPRGTAAAVRAPAGGSDHTLLDQAQKAALDGNPSQVRTILERRVMSGHASAEEARLLRAACKQMGDHACADAVNAKYP
jgi:eukaryotic-like serine/threonine-protein kinase